MASTINYPLDDAARAKRAVGLRARNGRRAGMVMAFYSLLLALGLLVAAPWWLLRMVTTQRYREGLAQRLGAVPAALREMARQHRIVWLHAVSVGEVLAVSRLVSELEEALNTAPQLAKAAGTEAPARAENTSVRPWRIVVSTTTRTGQALARERFANLPEGAARVFYFPLDFAFAVRRYLRVLRPAALLLAESELWPRVLQECAAGGVPVAVLNARVSDRSFHRAMRVRPLWRAMARPVSLWLAQSQQDAARLRDLGAREERVRVAGNLKYDIRSPQESRLLARLRDAAAGRAIVVAGSTVGAPERGGNAAEEPLVLEAWRRGAPESLLVLAPRHPERFAQVEALLEGLRYAKASDLLRGSGGPAAVRETEALQVLLLDTIGDLASVYSVASAAFVGGSLLPRGGHNPLEPAQFGVPVVTGPSLENFAAIAAALRAAGALQVVADAGELASTLQRLLGNPAEAAELGARARRVFQAEGGATARTVAALLPLILGQSLPPAGGAR